MATKKNIYDFFHYSPVYLPEVWKAHKYITEKGLPSKKITDEISGVFYTEQPSNNTSRHVSSGLTQKQIVALTEIGAYYIETPPMLHPAFINTIAGVLGITEKELIGVYSFNLTLTDGRVVKRLIYEDTQHTGPQYVQQLLQAIPKVNINGFEIKPAELMVTKIPILPQLKRPFISGILETTYPGVDNISYFFILKLADSLSVQNSISTFFDINAVRLLQQYFQELIIAVEYKLADNKWEVLKKLNELNDYHNSREEMLRDSEILGPGTAYIPMYRNKYDDEEMNFPLDIICISDTEICLQYPEKIAIYNMDEGKEVVSVSIKNFKIHKVNTIEKKIRLFGCHNIDIHQPSDFMHYNYNEKRWKPNTFSDIPCIELAHHTERNVLVNYKNGTEIILPELADAPAKKIHSACGKYMLIEDKHGNGGIYSIASGLCVLSSGEIHPLPDYDIPVFEITEKLSKSESVAYSENAIELSQQKNRFELGAIVIHELSCSLLYHELFYHNGKPIFEVDFPYCCAAFNKEGNFLFLASLYGLVTIDITSYLKSAEMKYNFLTLGLINSEGR